MGVFRMRTLLLVSLLALSFGLTALSLLAVRFTLNRQIQRDLRLDLQHSVDTFINLERQRREMLAQETALLADLPSLKALMTTQDARTIQDGGKDFWQVSGGDLFQLYNRSGRLVAAYGPIEQPHPAPLPGVLNQPRTESTLQAVIERPQETSTVAVQGRLFDVIAQPLFFGSRTNGILLGYVVLGFAIDHRVALEVSQAAAAEAAFTIDGNVAVSTLPPSLQPILNEMQDRLELDVGKVANLTLDRERYLATAMPLTAGALSGQGNIAGKANGQVRLVVLRSYGDATRLVATINRWLLGLGALALLLGTLIAVSISRRVTRPLETLVEGTRALGRGDFMFQLASGGTVEIRELTQAFDHMRLELEESQRAMVDSERLAIIGRMARSISHDLRHYISAMYANAEFLSLATTPQSEREELIFEVQTAVHGMTDLLDSLLEFSQTGKAIVLAHESLPCLIERAVGLLRAHPEARCLDLQLDHLPAIDAWVDATKFVRAVFNLLLNACQAANRGAFTPSVDISLTEDETAILLLIEDNGPGVPSSLIATMFEPFVSRGRENGTGLGLTLAQHIAQEHGGVVQLDESMPGKTVFSLSLNKQALNRMRDGVLMTVHNTESTEIEWRSDR